MTLRFGKWLVAFHGCYLLRWSIIPRLAIYAGWRHWSLIWLSVEVARGEVQ